MKNKKLIIILALALVAGFSYYFIISENNVKTKNDVEVSNITYSGNTIVEEKDGKKVWELTANTIEIEPTTKNTILKKVKGVFYQNNGEIITLTAPEAVYDVNNRDITIKGLVQVVSNNGATMQGDVFKWQAKESKLVGDGNIILKKEDTVLTGNHIEATAGLTKVKVQGNAKIIKGGK